MKELEEAVRAARDARAPAPLPAGSVETEIFPDGRPGAIGTVYLRNGACPLACVYCALYKEAWDRPATGEEIAAQVRAVRGALPRLRGIKLYNASSLFEPASIRQRPEDLDAIAKSVSDLELVVVESRAELVPRAPDFARRLSGRLEVAVGLEAADDRLLALLNKPTTVARFRQAAELLGRAGLLLRSFVLVGPPFVARDRAKDLARETFELARECGSRVVSLLPVVARHEPMRRLQGAGRFAPVTLDVFLAAVAACAGRGPILLAETSWLDELPACPRCRSEVEAALLRFNATQRLEVPSCARHEPPAASPVREARVPAEALAALAPPPDPSPAARLRERR